MQRCKPIPISQWRFIKKYPYKIILAETACQRRQGLQHTERLPNDSIVLFFDIPAGIHFHTRNCHFPIDIVSLDKYATILDVWTVGPNKQLIGPTPARTSKVLEANAGWAKQNKLRIGDKLSIIKGV